MRFLIRQAERLRGLPWVVRLVLGLFLLALGGLVLLNPFDSLTVLIVLIAVALLVDGIARLIGANRASLPWIQVAAGGIEILAAVIVAAWPLISVPVLALVIGAALILSGVSDLIEGFKPGRRRRVPSIMLGLALVIFGVLTVLWPDVSLIIIAVAFAVRMIVFGVTVIVRAIRYRGDLPDVHSPVLATKPAPVLVRGLDFVGRALLLVLALLAAAGSIYLHQGVPTPSAFYSPSASVPSAPGQLIRSEPYTHSVPKGARGWLILYTTTDLNDKPTVGSAFVMVSDQQSDAPRDVVLWDHGTQGADRSCAPTILPAPLPLTAPMAAMEQQLKEGRVLVGADYPGMGTSGPQGYLVGQNEGRSALDAVRAAHQLHNLRLSNRTVVWGHSQGGQAALWTGALATTYAPDLDVLGVAAAAPAADVKGLITTFRDSTIGKVLGPLIIRSFAETYPDVQAADYIDPRMYPIYEAASRRCIPETQSVVSLLTALTMQGEMFSTDTATGPLGARLDQNLPTGTIDAPLFIAQGAADPLILPKVQERYVRDRCAAGQALAYKEYKGRDHLSVVADDSPYTADLKAWTDDRFAGTPQKNTCG
jgi:uncharacterized membrane protein HdeD (DUF308 family)/pimeloyl-ACP methyl ester carboxylesterase